MIVSISRIKRWTKLFVLFILFTLLLYQVIAFMVPFWKAELLYPEPKGGGAVKVFSPYEMMPSETFIDEFKQRLYLFYLTGE